jgi:hypothetical protein
MHNHLLYVLFPNSYSLELKVLIYFIESLMQVFVFSCFSWNVSWCVLQSEIVKFASHQHCLDISKVCFIVLLLLICKCVMQQFVEVPQSTISFNGNICESWYSNDSDCEDTVSNVVLCRLVAGYLSEELAGSVGRDSLETNNTQNNPWKQFDSEDSYLILSYLMYLMYTLDMFYIHTLHCFVDSMEC